MIDLGDKGCCVCKKYENTQKECVNEFTISEQGKSVKLEPKTGEEVMAIVLDNCVITSDGKKCDALFLYQNSKDVKYSFLVELKGAGDLPKAFEQLSYTKNSRIEYQNIINELQINKSNKKFVIVSNGALPKTELENLENSYGIRVKKILHSEATTPIPDLKDIL